MFFLCAAQISLLCCGGEIENPKINNKRKFDPVPSYIENFYVHKKISVGKCTYINIDSENFVPGQSIYQKNCYDNHPINIQLNSSFRPFDPNTNSTVGKEHSENYSRFHFDNMCLSITDQPNDLNNISHSSPSIPFTPPVGPSRNFDDNDPNKVNRNKLYKHIHSTLDIKQSLEKTIENETLNSTPKVNNGNIGFNDQGNTILHNVTEFRKKKYDPYGLVGNHNPHLSTNLFTEFPLSSEYSYENTPMKKIASMVEQKQLHQENGPNPENTFVSLNSIFEHGSNINSSKDKNSSKLSGALSHPLGDKKREDADCIVKNPAPEWEPYKIAMLSVERAPWPKNLLVDSSPLFFGVPVHKELGNSLLFIITKETKLRYGTKSFMFNVTINKFFGNNMLQYYHFDTLVSQRIKQQNTKSCNVIFSLLIRRDYYQMNEKKYRLISVFIPEESGNSKFLMKSFVAYNNPLPKQSLLFRHVRNCCRKIYFTISLSSDYLNQRAMEYNKRICDRP